MTSSLTTLRLVAPDGTTEDRRVVTPYAWAVAIRRSGRWTFHAVLESIRPEADAHGEVARLRAVGTEAVVVPTQLIETARASRCSGLRYGRPCVRSTGHRRRCRALPVIESAFERVLRRAAAPVTSHPAAASFGGVR